MPTHAATQTDFEDVMLGRQSQDTAWSTYTKSSQGSEPRGRRAERGCRGLGTAWGVSARQDRVSIWGDEEALEMTVTMATQHPTCLTPLSCALNGA